MKLVLQIQLNFDKDLRSAQTVADLVEIVGDKANVLHRTNTRLSTDSFQLRLEGLSKTLVTRIQQKLNAAKKGE